MDQDQYTALIEQCVAEVNRSGWAGPRKYRPPANPMRAALSGGVVPGRTRRFARGMPGADVYLRPDTKPRRAGKLMLGFLTLVIGIVGIEVLAPSDQTPPPITGPSAPASAVRLTPQSQVIVDLRNGESCHQVERALMTTDQNKDGSFYTQA